MPIPRKPTTSATLAARVRWVALLVCGCADPVNTPAGASLAASPPSPTSEDPDFFAGASFVALSSGASPRLREGHRGPGARLGRSQRPALITSVPNAAGAR